MLTVRCPWCGERDEAEFSYGAEAEVSYPADPGALSDAEWAEFVFVRANPKGPLRERWVHTQGCRRWFDVVRDTSTNAFE
jgi:sarcosine oxidase subunit alpha/sarcosine oxidase subunit delta